MARVRQTKNVRSFRWRLQSTGGAEGRDEELKQGRARGNQHQAERGYDLLPDLSHFAYGDRMTPLVILSLKTGMRRGELFDLTWEPSTSPTR